MCALGVHAGQNFLLAELRDEEPLTTGELARRMHVEVPTVVWMAQRMESAGLLERHSDPGDGRRVLIKLTVRAARPPSESRHCATPLASRRWPASMTPSGRPLSSCSSA